LAYDAGMNKTTLCASVLAAAALLSGCAFNHMEAAAALNASDPITCRDKAQCDRYWLRLAQRTDKVTAHKFKEQTATRLSQFNPEFESTHPFIDATRVDAADGSGRIELGVSCMNPFGCFPRAHELAASLREYIRAPD
jgi:hypothetical protein